MIEPVEYRTSLAGKSRSYIITFSDGRDYAVKFMRPGFEKVLLNEWIAYCFARFLQLPVPYSRIVDIPEDFVRTMPNTSDVQFTSRQFASLYIPNSINLHQVESVASLVNQPSLAGIILLDYWLCNRDRTRDNLLLSEESSGGYQVWMIDHGDIFGAPNWTTKQLGRLSTNVYKSAAHQFITQFIQKEHDVMLYMEILKTIPKLLIEEIVATVPNEWVGSSEEQEAIVQTLLNRRDKQLESLLDKYIKKVYRPLHRHLSIARK